MAAKAIARNKRASTAHFAAGVGAALLFLIAFSPAFETLADRSFLWHMAQHMILIFGIAPLILLSAPLYNILRYAPHDVAKAIVNIMHAPPLRIATHPVVALLLFAAVLWGTHFSPIYELTLRDERVHLAEHIAYFVSAIFFWQNVIQIGPAVWPLAYPLRMLYVFSAIPQSAFLGVALFQTNHVLYTAYARTQAFPLADQRNGAALMWILGGILLFGTFMILAAAWANSERSSRQPPE